MAEELELVYQSLPHKDSCLRVTMAYQAALFTHEYPVRCVATLHEGAVEGAAW